MFAITFISNVFDAEFYLWSSVLKYIWDFNLAKNKCNCLSQWTYTGRICLIILYFQRQEIAAIGKYRLSLNINSIVNYFVALFLMYPCVCNWILHEHALWMFLTNNQIQDLELTAAGI